VIRQAVAEIAGTQADDGTLTDELAGEVRTRLRTSQHSFVGSGGSPMFSGRAVGPTGTQPDSRHIAPVFATQGGEPPPPQQFQGHHRSPDTAEPASPEADAVQSDGAPVGEYHDALSSQLAAQSAAAVQTEQWRAAGLGVHDGHLIEQCQQHGLTPEDLRRRVDGRTIASRLKNGESISSIRSRLA
jgi:hypothetical protein